MITTARITGHLAMSHTVTAASPMPTSLPTCWANPPVSVTAMVTAASMISSTSVVSTRVGTVFHMGRPSPTS